MQLDIWMAHLHLEIISDLQKIKPILIVSFWHSSLLHQSAHSCENCTH